MAGGSTSLLLLVYALTLPTSGTWENVALAAGLGIGLGVLGRIALFKLTGLELNDGILKRVGFFGVSQTCLVKDISVVVEVDILLFAGQRRWLYFLDADGYSLLRAWAPYYRFRDIERLKAALGIPSRDDYGRRLEVENRYPWRPRPPRAVIKVEAMPDTDFGQTVTTEADLEKINAVKLPESQASVYGATGVFWVVFGILFAIGVWAVWSSLETHSRYAGLKRDGEELRARIVRCSPGVLAGSISHGECRLSYVYSGQKTSYPYNQDMNQFRGLAVGDRVRVLGDGTDGFLDRVYTLHDVQSNYGVAAVYFKLVGGLAALSLSLLLGARLWKKDRQWILGGTRGSPTRPTA